jgi:transcriptional regulator with XRE-family HTH domain
MSDQTTRSLNPTAERGCNTVDAHIGARIRSRRRALDLTQDDLAGCIGVTAQQIHKYESGVNRVAASKLFEIATALTMPVSAFFAGLPEPAPAHEDETTRLRDRLLVDKDVLELAKRFDEIEEGALRRTVLRMVRAAIDDAGKDSD